jgi:CheY-like chemotaxis protein
LLANAVKFTDRGEVRLIVRFVPDDVLHFEVQDSGIGIQEDQLRPLFQPFEQVGEVRRRSSGTGLGLAISQQIVRMMGGEIHVESRPGEGSRFWFDVRLQVLATARSVASGSPPPVTGYEGPRKTILVADDVAENRQMLVDLLAPLGFATVEAEQGREALDKAGELRPDLIITDYVMPVMNGHEATRRLRQIGAIRHIPVIMLSARASLGDESEALASGADAFMARPVNVDKLLTAIAKLLKIAWTIGAPKVTEPVTAIAAADPMASMGVPPAEEMEELHRLALEGNMRKIVLWAQQVATNDPRYVAFTNQLCQLAQGYQSRAILLLVEAHLASPLGRAEI